MLRVEIDVTKSQQIRNATEFCHRYKCPAMVVPPDLVRDALLTRSMARSNHRIIATVDWPRGVQFHIDKFRGVAVEALDADGFEILLTTGSPTRMLKEIAYLSDFMRNHFPPTIETRFVLGWFADGRSKNVLLSMVEAMKQIPVPNFIRTTHLTKLTSTEGSTESHNKVLDNILATRRMPLKISGNIGLSSRIGCKQADRFACTLEQATALQKELSDHGLKELKTAVVGDEDEKEE